MQTAISKKQTAFRLSSGLIDSLRSEAKRQNRSLNNFVEMVLSRAVGYSANTETLAAIEEARSGKELEKLDLNNFDELVASL